MALYTVNKTNQTIMLCEIILLSRYQELRLFQLLLPMTQALSLEPSELVILHILHSNVSYSLPFFLTVLAGHKDNWAVGQFEFACQERIQRIKLSDITNICNRNSFTFIWQWRHEEYFVRFSSALFLNHPVPIKCLYTGV